MWQGAIQVGWASLDGNAIQLDCKLEQKNLNAHCISFSPGEWDPEILKKTVRKPSSLALTTSLPPSQ